MTHPAGVGSRWALPALFALALLLRTFGAGIPLERDEGEYAYIAWRWLDGHVPYADSFDQKPPAVFVVYAAILLALGDSPSAIRWGMQIFTLGTMAALYAFARSRHGGVVAALAAGLFVVATSGPAMLAHAANTEIFALLPLVSGMLLAERASSRGGLVDALGVGICAAWALLFKWVTAPMVLFSAIWVLRARPVEAQRAGRLALTMVLGGALGLAPVLAYFAGQGALGALVEATLVYNAEYATRVPFALYPQVFMLRVGQWLPAFWPILGLALVSLSGKGVPRSAEQGVGRLWGWLAAAFLAAASSGYFRPHYFILILPPICLLAAIGAERLLARLAPPGRRVALAPFALLAFVLLNVFASAPWYFAGASPEEKARRIYGWNPFPESREIAEAVAALSAPGDEVFVFGSEPQILFHARRPSASHTIYAYPWTGSGARSERVQREILAALRERPPRVIVAVLIEDSLAEQVDTPAILHRGLAELVRAGYRPVAYLRQYRDQPSRLRRDAAALRRLADGRSFVDRAGAPQIVIYARRDEGGAWDKLR